MGSTHRALFLHTVFSTQGRRPLLTEDIRPRLFDYLGGAIRNHGGVLLAAGGIEDHIHLLISWHADEKVSTLMREIKSRSSRWIHETFPHRSDFRWQDGYAVFSVSPSQVPKVKGYLANQEEHHRKRDSREELRELLRAHGVEFDERYL